MMIKNLSLQLNEAGKIKIGKKGGAVTSSTGTTFRAPKKLDHFQLTTTEKNSDGDYIVDVDLQNKIKASGAGLVNKDGCLVGLPIRLLYDDTELNFPTQYVSYVSGQLSCSGDGETSRKRIDDYKVEHPCPCPRVDQGYEGKDKCKPTGTLTVVIDEAGLFGQAHKFRTTSMNSIKGILGGIELIKTATGGRIAGLPLMLTLTQKQTVTPGGASTIYIVSVCYRGNLADLKAEALRIMADEKQYMIAMDGIENAARVKDGIGIAVGTDEEREFVEEFFPHAAVVEPVVEAVVDPVAVEPVKNEQAVSETVKTEQEPFNTDTTTATEKPAEDLPGILVPAGQYKKVYEAFKAEKDFYRAMALAKRMQKGNLLYWLANTYSDIEFEPNIKKPETLELIENVLRSTLQVKEENKLADPEPIIPATPPPVQTYTEDDGTEYVRSWDDSGPITKDQLRRLVQLKVALEKQGVLKPDKWPQHVQFFTDAAGKEISTAVNLTTVQGDTFIRMLESNLKTEEIAV
jgi:hypothetical protein